jgi:hypothetical protein
MGVPDDIAAAVSYLTSDAAGFITGERLTNQRRPHHRLTHRRRCCQAVCPAT